MALLRRTFLKKSSPPSHPTVGPGVRWFAPAGAYHGVPHVETLAALQSRCSLHSVETVGPGDHVEVSFPG